MAILTPRWLEYILSDATAPAIYRLGEKVFAIEEGLDPTEGTKKTVEAVSKFCFEMLGLKSTLTDLQIDSTHFKAMAEHACMGGAISGPKELTPSDVEKIYEMCL